MDQRENHTVTHGSLLTRNMHAHTLPAMLTREIVAVIHILCCQCILMTSMGHFQYSLVQHLGVSCICLPEPEFKKPVSYVRSSHFASIAMGHLSWLSVKPFAAFRKSSIKMFQFPMFQFSISEWQSLWQPKHHSHIFPVRTRFRDLAVSMSGFLFCIESWGSRAASFTSSKRQIRIAVGAMIRANAKQELWKVLAMIMSNWR